MLCQYTLFCNQPPSQAKTTAHLGLTSLITAFLHSQEIILYQILVALGSVVRHSPNTTSYIMMRECRVEQRSTIKMSYLVNRSI